MTGNDAESAAQNLQPRTPAQAAHSPYQREVEGKMARASSVIAAQPSAYQKMI